ncbi:MAG: hypothetical protein ACK4PR_12920 [Gammaproteobacteria bacterium]
MKLTKQKSCLAAAAISPQLQEYNDRSKNNEIITVNYPAKIMKAVAPLSPQLHVHNYRGRNNEAVRDEGLGERGACRFK